MDAMAEFILLLNQTVSLMPGIPFYAKFSLRAASSFSVPQEASLCKTSSASSLLIAVGPWDKLAEDQWTEEKRSQGINFSVLAPS